MNTSILWLLGSAVLIYLAWHYLHKALFHSSYCRPSHRIGEYLFYRLTGFGLLGVSSFWLGQSVFGLDLKAMGLVFSLSPLAWKYVLAALLLLPTLMLWIGPQKENLWQNPKIRAQRWSWSLVGLNSITWVVYLLAYEFFFRGMVFFPVVAALGLPLAIAINVVFYTLAHLNQGKEMMIGAAIFSFVLCLICYHTGTFYTAFLIHVINALANDWISLYHHPEMRVKGLM